MKRQLLSVLLASVFASAAFAIDIPQDKVPEPKRFAEAHYLTPQEVYDIKTKEGNNVLLVDIRTPYELQFVGSMPIMDGNIPYITYDYSGWDDKKKEYKRNFNSGFVGQVEDLMQKLGMSGAKDTKIILSCRSGDRSARAAELMAKSGYTNVWSAIEGFEGDKAKDGDTKGKRTVNGWKNAGLPWTYDLEKSKAGFIE